MLANSDNFRAKFEGRQLVDLGTTVNEKYGDGKSWQYGLRVNDGVKKLCTVVNEEQLNKLAT